MNNITDKLRIHLTLSFKMLKNIVEKCPENQWITDDENKSVWKRVLHVLESIDYWCDDFSEYQFDSLFIDISAEMDCVNKITLTKNEMLQYLNVLDIRIKNYFKKLDDDLLLQVSSKHLTVSYFDIIISQIRHIQINLGYCNEKLNSNGITSPEWLGYNEE